MLVGFVCWSVDRPWPSLLLDSRVSCWLLVLPLRDFSDMLSSILHLPPVPMAVVDSCWFRPSSLLVALLAYIGTSLRGA